MLGLVFRRTISHNPHFTKIPLQEHYIQLLVKEGLQEMQAKELITTLDNQIRQQYIVPVNILILIIRLYSKSGKYMSGREYGDMMKKYEDSINTFRQHIFSSQKEIMETLRLDYTNLEQEINQTQQKMSNETRQLESGMQLDLNFEVKRRAEMRQEIDQKTELAGQYANEQLNAIQEDLQQVSKQARTAIMAFGSVAFVAIVLFHTSS